GTLALGAAGVVVAASLRGRDVTPDITTPAGVTLTYALAEGRGDGAIAWGLLASDVRARYDRDQFVLRTSHAGEDRTFLTTEDERIDGDTASVVLVRTYAGSPGFFGSTGSA